MLDPVLLSRIQYGMHIGFHYIFPPLSIGLCLIIILTEGAFLFTKKTIYQRITRFWVKIFALIFALGVATGIINVFGLGTNWAGFSKYVGDIFGGILGAEAIFAFTLEAGFLGILLFGWNRVSHKLHFFSTLMVAIGAHMSAFWIVCANSWMQTPAGYHIVGEGAAEHAELTSYWAALINPSALTRLGHVYLGCWLSGSFLVCSVSAYYLLKNRHIEFAKKSLTFGLWLAGISIILQGISGDSSGRGVAKWQPAKLAAFEGVYKTVPYTPMYLWGVSDPKANEVKYGVKIPALLSFLVYRNFETPVTGLDNFPKEDWPVASVVFQTYHLMIALWTLMLIIVIWAVIKALRKTLFTNSKWCLRFLVIAVVFPTVANLVGWVSVEMGRQPWLVYNVFRTKDGVSKSLAGYQVLWSAIMLAVIFFSLACLFFYLLDQKIRHGPEDLDDDAIDPYRDPYRAKGKS